MKNQIHVSYKKRSKRRNQKTILSLACLGLFVFSLILSGASSYNRMVSVYADGKTRQFYSASVNIPDILKEHQIAVDPLDDVASQINDREINITISRAIDVSITADGNQITKKARPSWTVMDAIQNANITVQDQDIVTPSPNTPLKKDMSICIQRVTHSQRKQEEPLLYQTVIRASTKLKPGRIVVKTPGRNGKVLNGYDDEYIDGKYQQSTLVSSQTMVPAVNQVVLVGVSRRQMTVAKQQGKSELTIPSTLQLDASGRPVHYQKMLSGKGCAYSANPGAHTSTGRTVMPGYIAVNPKIIPYGTAMYIVSTDGYVYGYAIAADTGADCRNNKILADLFMNTKQECIQFGARTLQIYIL